MRIFVTLLVLFLTISLSGCAGNPTNEKPISEPAASSSAVANKQEEVTIKAYYEKPLSLQDKNTILLDGLQDGEEYIEVIVVGEIFDIEQIELSWDEKTNELKEKETFNRIEKLSNQTLVIKTYQSETIPGEKIKWKSRSGKSYEYVIQEDGVGGTDNGTKFEIN
ncbi:MAG: hypothetical protein CVU87_13325 [Firmicutes bacterium HGW-Firmicutes-12]|nr:MAG: hypothetical protein CVU87_13325 [Firmicutes bacterium HGW-Firmicutes-12]